MKTRKEEKQEGDEERIMKKRYMEQKTKRKRTFNLSQGEWGLVRKRRRIRKGKNRR